MRIITIMHRKQAKNGFSNLFVIFENFVLIEIDQTTRYCSNWKVCSKRSESYVSNAAINLKLYHRKIIDFFFLKFKKG